MHHEREHLLDALAMVVASGMGIADALTVIVTDARGRRLRAVLARLRADVDTGVPLADALARTRLFPVHALALIRIGEAAGRLPEHLTLAMVQAQRDRLFRSKILSAMLYPSIVLAFAVLIGIAVAWFILPRLALIFSGLGVDLPILTRWLIAAGTFLRDYGVMVIPGTTVGIAVIAYCCFRYQRTRVIGEAMLLRIPGVSRMLRELELARFGSLLGALIRAGVPIVDALDAIRDAATLVLARRISTELRAAIADGATFSQAFAGIHGVRQCIPLPVQHLLASAEQSGKLAEALERVGATYAERADATARNLTVILEPLLLVAVWLVVLTVAVAVVLPIYGLIGQLG